MKTIVPTSCGTSIKVLGAISDQRIIDISLRDPITVAGSKKRRTDSTIVTTVARIGTEMEYYLRVFEECSGCSGEE